ncbi:GFA family protein [Rhizobium sp. LjRoot30]|uniref:GFA family protein n=1 Tax=Rhizobium sp. LjRoot30 TaxID=3342320 RepID=UPI003ED0E71E
MRIDGQCHCGYVRYEAEIDPASVSICHCTDCQMLTGTAYRVSVAARRQDFRLLSNAPKQYAKTGDSGRVSLQFFCPECGSPIYRCSDRSDDPEIAIRLGTIRQRQDLRPRRQIWCRSALPWVEEIGQLPRRPGD